jgi:hypothetical protein
MNFIANVIASVVASAIVLVCAALASKRARWILTATLGRLLDIDVEYVFKNAAESESDVRHELDRATSIRFLSGRGNDLQRELFSQSINGRPGPTPFHI